MQIGQSCVLCCWLEQHRPRPPCGCPLLRRAAGSGAQGSKTRCQGVKTKPVIPREQAKQDVDEALAYYLSDAGEAVAFRFIDALEKAYAHIDPPEQVRQKM